MNKELLERIVEIIEDYKFHKKTVNLNLLESAIECQKDQCRNKKYAYLPNGDYYIPKQWYYLSEELENMQNEYQQELEKRIDLEKKFDKVIEMLSDINVKESVKNNQVVIEILENFDAKISEDEYYKEKYLVAKAVFIEKLNSDISIAKNEKYLKNMYNYFTYISLNEVPEAFGYNTDIFKSDDFELLFRLKEKRQYVMKSYSYILSSTLTDNQEFMDQLSVIIKDENYLQYRFDCESVKEIEKVFKICPDIDINFVFAMCKKDFDEYLCRYIDDQKMINNILQIKSLKDVNNSLLREIFELYDKPDREIIKKEDSKYDKIVLSVLYETRKYEIIENYHRLSNYYNEEYNIMENVKIRIAMMKAKTIEHQNKLAKFLEIEEIRKNILEDDSIYEKMLLQPINSENIDDYGNYSRLFENCGIFRKSMKPDEYQNSLINLLANNGLEYFYTGIAGRIEKVPVSLYVDFLKNVFDGNYVEQISQFYSEDFNPGVLPFYDEDVFGYIIDDDYKNTALSVIKFGANTSSSTKYDINEEIYWNYLIGTAVKEDKGRELVKSNGIIE